MDHQKQPIKDKILTGVFILMIFMPLTGQILDFDFFPNQNENRNLNPMPSFPQSLEESKKFSSNFTKYYQDNFGFRNTYLRLYSYWRRASSNAVYEGVDGWLFTGGYGSEDRQYKPLRKKQVRKWKNYMLMIKPYLESKNIEYFFMMPPSKASIYPELMPKKLRKRWKIKTSQYDQLKVLLKTQANVDIIDPREYLRNQKSNGELFFRTDTHWSYLGAFHGYQYVINQMRKKFPSITPPLKLENFTTLKSTLGSGDLALMLGQQELFSENHEKLILKPKTQLPKMNDSLRILIIHDSFMSLMVEHFKRHFKNIKFIFSREVTAEMINQFKPDILLQEDIEYYTDVFVPVLRTENGHSEI